MPGTYSFFNKNGGTFDSGNLKPKNRPTAEPVFKIDRIRHLSSMLKCSLHFFSCLPLSVSVSACPVAPGDGTGVCLPVEDTAMRCPMKYPFLFYFIGVANLVLNGRGQRIHGCNTVALPGNQAAIG